MKKVFKKKVFRKNPFRISFLYAVAFCCLTLSVIFFEISYVNNNKQQNEAAQNKANLVVEDFEKQLEMMEGIALRIATNYQFQPFYLKGNIARELNMLELFKQYSFFSNMTEEYFLYYGGDRIYRSTGSTLDFDLYINMKSNVEEQKERFLTELSLLLEERKTYKAKVLPVFNEVYVLIPIKANEGNERKNAILGFVIDEATLGDRIQLVGSVEKDRVLLYGEEGVLYQNGYERSWDKKAVRATTIDEQYTILYYPKKTYFVQSGTFLLMISLFLIDIILIVTVANAFAKRAYDPLLTLAETYRDKISDPSKLTENAIEELGNILDSMVQSNIESSNQIRKDQKLLRNQILRMLLEGSSTLDVLPSLEKVDVRLPGPLFFVMVLSFSDDITEEFLEELQSEVEQLSDEETEEFIYTLSNYQKKKLNVICSYENDAQKKDLVELICEVAAGFGYQLVAGIGNTYSTVSGLSASWLESTDEIQGKLNPQRNQESVYDSEKMNMIYSALETGNEEEALKRFGEYIEQMNQKTVSLLVQQYVIAGFLSGLGTLGKKYRIELSKNVVSTLIAAKNMKDFEAAGRNAIHNFCGKLDNSKSKVKDEESVKIFEYIKAHFTEYDLSQEKVASDLNVKTAAVRQAVVAQTGKMYKDYLIELRIDYAKRLLCKEDLQVAEICEKVGYGNVSHFIKIFREMTGLTPSKFRKEMLLVSNLETKSEQ